MSWSTAHLHDGQQGRADAGPEERDDARVAQRAQHADFLGKALVDLVRGVGQGGKGRVEDLDGNGLASPYACCASVLFLVHMTLDTVPNPCCF